MGIPEVNQLPDLNRQMHLLVSGKDAAQEAASRQAGHVIPSFRTGAMVAGGLATGDIKKAGEALVLGEAMKHWFTPSLASAAEGMSKLTGAFPTAAPIASTNKIWEQAAEQRRKAKLGQ